MNVIIINGRIHKASYKEFLRGETAAELKEEKPTQEALTNYVAYSLDDGTKRTRMGHLDVKNGEIIPLSFVSGTPIENLYQVLEVGQDHIKAGGKPFPLDSRHVIIPEHLRKLFVTA